MEVFWKGAEDATREMDRNEGKSKFDVQFKTSRLK